MFLGYLASGKRGQTCWDGRYPEPALPRAAKKGYLLGALARRGLEPNRYFKDDLARSLRKLVAGVALRHNLSLVTGHWELLLVFTKCLALNEKPMATGKAVSDGIATARHMLMFLEKQAKLRPVCNERLIDFVSGPESEIHFEPDEKDTKKIDWT